MFVFKLTPERVRHGYDGYDTSDTFSDGAVTEDDSEPEPKWVQFRYVSVETQVV